MRFHLFSVIVALCLSYKSRADSPGPPAARPSPPLDKPYGAYYCQARCLSSCLETYLAPTLDDCQKFCPPFLDDSPCPSNDTQCWLTCGVAPNDQPSPDTPDLTPVGHQQVDPFLIELAWTAVPNASVYIVEFYPRNRQPKPGESNFFQVMTTSLAYTVRKEDECVEYSARVIAVNSYGVSVPAYTYIPAPIPTMAAGDHFTIRKMEQDPLEPDMVTVTVDYSLPLGWPIDDIDIDRIQVTATECKGPLGESFGNVTAPTGGLRPLFNAIIGKAPTTAIQVSLANDVLVSDCLFQMRVGALATRCNTTVDYDLTPSLAPGVDFRINCDTVEDACGNDTAKPNLPPPVLAPIPVPTDVVVDPDVVVPPLSMPGFVPPGVSQPNEKIVRSNSSSEDTDDMPTPPPLPLFFVGESGQDKNVPQLEPGLSVSVINANAPAIQTMPVITDTMFLPLCDLDMLDAQPTPNQFSDSLIDLNVQWLEHQPLPPLPPPAYFTIRYGPIIRKLVDYNRQTDEILPGYETIVRTKAVTPEMPFLPDPTREINITELQRGTLLKIQICAIFDPNSETLIEWDKVLSARIDLAALEPFLESPNPEPSSMPGMVPDTFRVGAAPVPLLPIDSAGPSTNGNEVIDVPLIIAVDVNQKASATTQWVMALTGFLFIILTAVLVFVFLRYACSSRRVFKRGHETPVFIVKTESAPPPVMNEVVKVPLP